MADAEGMEFQANQGTPDQLPQGAATALNEALPSPGELAPDELAPIPGTDGADEAYPDGTETFGEPGFSPQGMDEEILFLDSERGEVAGPVQLPAGRLPDSVVRMLDTMGAAASEPGAPESLRAIYAAAVNALDAGLR